MTKRLFAILLLLLAVSVPSEARPFYRNPKWWLGVAVIGTAVALDAHSSCQSFSRGAFEANPLIYGTRSCGKVAALEVGAFSFYTTLHALEYHVTQRDPNRFIRYSGLVALPAIAVGVHIPEAIHNYSLNETPTLSSSRRDDDRKD